MWLPSGYNAAINSTLFIMSNTLSLISRHMSQAVAKHGKKDSTGAGTCFITSLETFITACSTMKGKAGKLPVLCQAICYLADSTVPVSHGYIEVDGYVVDLDGIYSAGKWKKTARPTCINRYSYPQAMDLALKTGHYGPWDDRLHNHGELAKAILSTRLLSNEELL